MRTTYLLSIVAGLERTGERRAITVHIRGTEAFRMRRYLWDDKLVPRLE